VTSDWHDLDFSIVMPTYQRRTLVVATVQALARQQYRGGFEVVVVVDDWTDNSATALRALEVPFPLTVLDQANQGIAAACNHGASVSRRRGLLFLDDDMEAAPRLLAEHARACGRGSGTLLRPAVSVSSSTASFGKSDGDIPVGPLTVFSAYDLRQTPGRHGSCPLLPLRHPRA